LEEKENAQAFLFSTKKNLKKRQRCL